MSPAAGTEGVRPPSPAMLDRRAFIGRAMHLGAGLMSAPSLHGLLACRSPHDMRRGAGFGPLQVAGPELAVPRGFEYAVLSVEGQPMTDDTPSPGAHDGMGCFAMPNGNVRLVRNHEDRNGPGTVVMGDVDQAYDERAGGGTTSLEVAIPGDGPPRVEREFVSLGGTTINCAGGITPWGTWLSCEETTAGAREGWAREHGYVFEVPALSEAQTTALPRKAMGRFIHEAVAVDPTSGIVYETEDRGTAGFYRFLPGAFGDLAAGGLLQMAKVVGVDRYETFRGQDPGRVLDIEWVDIPDPDPPSDSPSAVSRQGFGQGAAVFRRLEGCWPGDGGIYFHATTGGDLSLGQVWFYRPDTISRGWLRLVYESSDPAILNGPDNLVVGPRGGLIICEDASPHSYLRGLNPDGDLFDIAQNILHGREFAGATFAPDGRTLFVNIQGDTRRRFAAGNLGMTFAIWGPWEEAGL